MRQAQALVVWEEKIQVKKDLRWAAKLANKEQEWRIKQRALLEKARQERIRKNRTRKLKFVECPDGCGSVICHDNGKDCKFNRQNKCMKCSHFNKQIKQCEPKNKNGNSNNTNALPKPKFSNIVLQFWLFESRILCYFDFI